jgi:hypothetical protein
MPNHVSVIDEHSIRLTLVGDQTEVNFAPTAQEAEVLANEARAANRSINVLVDVTQVGHVTLGVRQLSAKNLREWPLNRVAIFGANTYLRHLANLVIVATGNQKSRLFKTEEEALVWLRNG